MERRKEILKNKAKTELINILDYWLKNTIDKENGGFIGEINHQNVINNNSEKGAVLNARILWSFSAAYAVEKNPEYLKTAKRAFQYIKDYFFDKEFGGIFWSLQADGKPKDTKNQIYAIAFVIYGLSEFYKIFKNEDALELAQSLFYKIELYSKDYKNKGYLEAFTRDWQEIEDLRLSEKDANEKKDHEYASSHCGSVCQFIPHLAKPKIKRFHQRNFRSYCSLFYQQIYMAFKTLF